MCFIKIDYNEQINMLNKVLRHKEELEAADLKNQND